MGGIEGAGLMTFAEAYKLCRWFGCPRRTSVLWARSLRGRTFQSAYDEVVQVAWLVKTARMGGPAGGTGLREVA